MTNNRVKTWSEFNESVASETVVATPVVTESFSVGLASAEKALEMGNPERAIFLMKRAAKANKDLLKSPEYTELAKKVARVMMKKDEEKGTVVTEGKKKDKEECEVAEKKEKKDKKDKKVTIEDLEKAVEAGDGVKALAVAREFAKCCPDKAKDDEYKKLAKKAFGLLKKK